MDIGADGGPKPRKKKLTRRQLEFVRLLADDPTLTQTEAAERAGFKDPRQSGSQLLNLPQYAHVKAELDWLRAERQQRLGITPLRTLERLAELAYTDARNLFNTDGTPKNFTELSKAEAALVREVKRSWTTVKVQKPDGTVETVIKPNVQMKVSDPLGAIKLLMKHQGLLIERVQLNVTEKAEQAQRDIDALFEQVATAAVGEFGDALALADQAEREIAKSTDP